MEIKGRFGDRATTSAALLEQHGHDESHHSWHPPDLVVFAESTEDVTDVVALCSRYRVPIVAFGAGTSLEGQVNAVKGASAWICHA